MEMTITTRRGAGHAKVRGRGAEPSYPWNGWSLCQRTMRTHHLLTEEPASASAVSEYDAVSEAPSFPPSTVTSSKGRSPTRSLSSKKRVVAEREDLAFLSLIMEFRAFREAENWGIELPQSVKGLLYRCDARRSTPPGTNLPIPLQKTWCESKTLLKMHSKWLSLNADTMPLTLSCFFERV